MSHQDDRSQQNQQDQDQPAAPTVPQDKALWLQLTAIAGRPDADDDIEVRWKPRGREMRREFHRADRLEAIVPAVLGRARHADVYLGCAPRRRGKGGGKDAIGRAWQLWVDCDTAEAEAALRAFRPLPNLVIRTGRRDHLHAYWTLREAISPAEAEGVCKRLAAHLGADEKSTDIARILRAAGTQNHKHDPPLAVECVRLEIDGRLPVAAEVLANVPALAIPAVAAPVVPRAPRALVDAGDVLLSIPATDYVPALTGQEVGRDGKIVCPFHDDSSPSLHVHDDGWYCYGCERGGSIVDFGAHLYGIEPRGRGYHDVRRALSGELLGVAA
jgi:CHC2-type zinc finger protein/DNA primase RepB-like protein